jgi:porin
MGSPLSQSGFVATTYLLWWMLLGSPAFAQEDGPLAAPTIYADLTAPFAGFPNFDAGQETPAPPDTPAYVPDRTRDGAILSRFLLGEVFGLRPMLTEEGVSLYVSSTQFEPGVAAGGIQQAFRWGSKFDMLAHVDSGNLGLWEGGTLDLFAESRLGRSVDGFTGTFSPTNLAMFIRCTTSRSGPLRGSSSRRRSTTGSASTSASSTL